MTDKKVEYRHVEFRLDSANDNEVRIEGRGVPYGSQTTIGSWFTEEFEQGAFKESKDNEDVVLLAGHQGMPLARNGAGTMEFKEKKDGLYFYANLDTRDSHAQSMAVKIERGDLTGASVGFIAEEVAWRFTEDDDELDQRIIKRGRLIEMSLTPFPAYGDTNVAARDIRDLARTNKGYNNNDNHNAGKRLNRELFPLFIYQ